MIKGDPDIYFKSVAIVWFIWVRLWGTTSKFWDIIVCPFVCLCIQSGTISKFPWCPLLTILGVRVFVNLHIIFKTIDRMRKVQFKFPSIKWTSLPSKWTDKAHAKLIDTICDRIWACKCTKRTKKKSWSTSCLAWSAGRTAWPPTRGFGTATFAQAPGRWSEGLWTRSRDKWRLSISTRVWEDEQVSLCNWAKVARWQNLIAILVVEVGTYVRIHWQNLLIFLSILQDGATWKLTKVALIRWP